MNVDHLEPVWTEILEPVRNIGWRDHDIADTGQHGFLANREPNVPAPDNESLGIGVAVKIGAVTDLIRGGCRPPLISMQDERVHDGFDGNQFPAVDRRSRVRGDGGRIFRIFGVYHEGLRRPR